jgi:hypothetical protein
MKPNRSKPWLVMDNHKAHHTRLIDDLLKEHFRVTYLPPYSC